MTSRNRRSGLVGELKGLDETTLARLIAAAYVAIVLAVTMLPVFGIDPRGPIVIRTTPFETIRIAVRHGFWSEEFALLLANIAMFVPLGILVPLAFRASSGLRVLILAAGLSAGIEITQLAISIVVGFGYRTADIDDVTLNTCGALLGYAFLRALRHRLPATR